MTFCLKSPTLFAEENLSATREQNQKIKRFNLCLQQIFFLSVKSSLGCLEHSKVLQTRSLLNHKPPVQMQLFSKHGHESKDNTKLVLPFCKKKERKKYKSMFSDKLEDNQQSSIIHRALEVTTLSYIGTWKRSSPPFTWLYTFTTPLYIAQWVCIFCWIRNDEKGFSSEVLLGP